MSEQRHNQLGIHPLAPDQAGSGELLKRDQVVRRTRLLVLIVLILLALGAARTVVSRIRNASELETGTRERAMQYVQTTLPSTPENGQSLALPGTLQGYVQAPLSARASGYLKRWTRDIGSRVEKGDLLAEIETPEIDQQLSQAIAAREQAKAALTLANSTLARWEALRRKDVVSQQDLEEKRGSAAQASANLAAAQANEQRLRQLEGFKRIVAPFSGIITRRNVDVGDLIDAGSGRPLFLMSQTDPLRVYINVPQRYAQQVKPGEHVTVTQAELGGQKFTGTIARTAASIDLATRTMQVEISLRNPDSVLLPGAYVSVALDLPAGDTLAVPTNTLLFRREGTMVAVVGPDGRIDLRRVTLGRNFGQNIEVADGVRATDRIVLNPADSLATGDVVHIAQARTAPPTPVPTPSIGPARSDAGDAGDSAGASGTGRAAGSAQ
ncbi:efflux RND transporter periplasmic adaptor subunit [Bordetella genomosp. 11]|uniref:Efflux transporter periplasmic adaptor subunit n=1 Tax=Bordetella genomosp. 11 TaxID=1416808 RepID=A0A261UFQ9_9BORD|nr:efflux RND transporter periplasmic adaptor subunit [Bordetella genomosp. 11]OZI60425.1 efflux transporter periplasmic adaptor subunit [Bordetella genomosp. 11]